MKLKNITKFALMASATMLSAGATQAATVANGDLILFFQKVGSQNTVYANLGSAATLYRGTAAGPNAELQNLNIINVNASLVTAYGLGWASDTSIFAGIGAVRSNTVTSELSSDPVLLGDQTQTLYVSRARTDVGTVGQANSTLWDLSAGGAFTSVSTDMLTLRSNFSGAVPGSVTQGVITSLTSSVIDDRNPINASTFAQGVAFGSFVGGVQQRNSATAFGVFGDAGQVEFALDLNRLTPDLDLDAGEIAGPFRSGSYEGTITVGTTGVVSFVTVPEPSGTLALGILGTLAGLGYRRRRA